MSQNDSVANVITTRTLSLTKEWVELRIFILLTAIMSAEPKVLNIQATVQIKIQFNRDGRREIGKRGGVLLHPKVLYTWKFTQCGREF